MTGLGQSALGRSYGAELARIVRRRVVGVTALCVLAFAIGGAAIVTAAAKPDPGFGPEPSVSIASLSSAGGGTEVFRLAVSFAGTFVFVVFVGLVAMEFARGTVRTMLLRQPRRTALLVGKVAALLTFAAGALAAGGVATWLAARVLAPGQGIDTSGWLSLDAIGAALGDYVAVLVWVTGYAVLATAVAVVVRSVPLALAVGIAWAGPVEHLVQNAWEGASRVFPGLSLEAFVAGGTPDVSVSRALVTATAYAVIGAEVALVVFARRDVTS